MKYNLLGNTGLLVSELCLGTMTFGNQGLFGAIGGLGQKEADELVKKAIDSGVNFIDTANVYSGGQSEEITGQAIRNLGIPRNSLVLATKVRSAVSETPGPNDKGLSRKHIMHEVDASLRRLQTDYIDLYQIHSFDPLTPLEETIKTLDDLVHSGKVRYIGASNLAAWQFMRALDYSHYNQLERFVSLQAYYSLVGRDLEREIVPMLLHEKVGLMVWSPLAGGFLSGKYSREDSKDKIGRRSNLDFPPVDKEKGFDVIDVLRGIAQGKSTSITQLSLAWLLHQPVVSSVIIGVKNITQLDDNLKASEIRFSTKELEQLGAISKLNEEYPGWIFDFSKDRTLD